MGGDARQSQVDGRVLRSALPEGDEIGFSLVETAGDVAIAESAGEAELILRVGGIAGESGPESGNGVVVVRGFGTLET